MGAAIESSRYQHMSRKSTSSKKFVAPRGEDGKFLPRDQWSKATQKEFERLKKQGIFKNPIVRSSSGRRRGKDIWIPPQDKNGQFLPMDRWSTADKKAYRRALKDGLVPGGLVPRGYAGRFSTEVVPKSRRSRSKVVEAIVPRSMDVEFESDDLYDIKRGIRRLEHRLEDLTDEFDRSAHRQLLPERGGSCGYGVVRGRRSYSDKPQNTTVHQQQPIEDVEAGYTDPNVEDVEWSESACSEDPCDAEILSEIQDLKNVCGESIKRLEEHRHDISQNRSLTRNRAERALMYNRPRSLSRCFDSIVESVKAHPVLAIIGVGAFALVGYALYRWIRSLVSTLTPGTQISGGVMSFPGTTPYTLTTDDSLWLIRSIWGEVNRSDRDWETSRVQQGAAAVMWAMANNYMTVGAKRTRFATFGDFVQAYSQPINPAWINPDATKCQQRPDMCTPQMISFRVALRSKPWAQFPEGARALVTAFVQGTLRNPIGIRTDFRAANTGYRPADPVNVADNIFGTDPTARRRTLGTMSA